MDVYPIEQTQAKLEQVIAFVDMLTNEYRREYYHDGDNLRFETNMITLFDMVYDIHADLSKSIDDAYNRHRRQV